MTSIRSRPRRGRPASGRRNGSWRPRRPMITRTACGSWRWSKRKALRWSGCGATGSAACARTANGKRTPRAKATMAIVVSPPSRRRLQPIAPSADWRFDLAEGCPAHCQYCYLAGSLSGPPVTRVYADLDTILAGLRGVRGPGHDHQPPGGAARRGHHVRGVLLYRSAGAGAPDRQLAAGSGVLRRLGRPGAAALDDEVR